MGFPAGDGGGVVYTGIEFALLLYLWGFVVVVFCFRLHYAACGILVP